LSWISSATPTTDPEHLVRSFGTWFEADVFENSSGGVKGIVIISCADEEEHQESLASGIRLLL